MRRVIGMDIHRTFAEVVFWEGGRLRWYGRVDMTRAGLEGFGRGLTKSDEVVLEATGNAMAVVRVLRPYVARVIIANPLQVKAIAHAHVKTDKIDAGVLASLHAAGFLPEVWLPDAETERLRRLVARRNQIVRQRTRVKNETHAILAAHLVPPCPHAELFNGPGRAWLARQSLPDDERAAIERHLRELDRLGEDLGTLDRDIGVAVVDQPAVRRLLTIAGMNVTVAAGLVAAIGDIRRFSSPPKLVSYFGLNPRVRQSGLGLAQHGRISKIGRAHARALLVEAAWAAAKAPGPLHAFFLRIRARRGHARWRSSSGISWPRRPTISGRGRRWSPTSCARSSCRPAGRCRRATSADPPLATTSRRYATRSWRSPNRPSAPMSTSSASGDRSPHSGA
jgi:transposase